MIIISRPFVVRVRTSLTENTLLIMYRDCVLSFCCIAQLSQCYNLNDSIGFSLQLLLCFTSNMIETVFLVFVISV